MDGIVKGRDLPQSPSLLVMEKLGIFAFHFLPQLCMLILKSALLLGVSKGFCDECLCFAYLNRTSPSSEG